MASIPDAPQSTGAWAGPWRKECSACRPFIPAAGASMPILCRFSVAASRREQASGMACGLDLSMDPRGFDAWPSRIGWGGLACRGLDRTSSSEA